jgi:hypothetical protein
MEIGPVTTGVVINKRARAFTAASGREYCYLDKINMRI